MICGVGGYLAGLPLLAIGLVIMTFLARLSGEVVSHPIQSEITDRPLFIVILACVFAPLSEELLFRGAFLSHLRARWNPWVAGGVTAFVFAAIHPQGWAAIPLLGSIGFTLALIRQWRRTLVASITAHALNNGIVVGMLLLLS